MNDMFIAQYMGELVLKYIPYKFTCLTPCNLVGAYRRFGETGCFFYSSKFWSVGTDAPKYPTERCLSADRSKHSVSHT